MYEDNDVTYKVSINWQDILIKIIMLILFILALLWLFPKPKLDVFYDQVYTNNIKEMKEAARDYYTVDRLPKNVGDQTSMTLKEMFDDHMLVKFTDKDGKTCNEKSSGVSVTKNSENEYTLKVELNCGDQKDYILDTIGCTSVCSNGTCQTIITNNGGNSNNNIANNGSSTNNDSTPSLPQGGDDTVKDNTNWEDMDGSVKDTIQKVKVTYYQHRKPIVNKTTIYTCPTGYTKEGTKCIKEVTGAEIPATPVYNPDKTITVDAKVNTGDEHIEYIAAIKEKVDTKYTCPTGYTLNGSYCIKYTDSIENKEDDKYTCPSGYDRNGTKCIKTYDATYKSGDTSYSCPNGGNLNGTKCTLRTNATPHTEYTCPSGYTKSGSSCYKVYTASSNTTYTCPNGGTLNGTKCNKSSSYNASCHTVYGSWISQGTKYYTSAGAAYTGDTSKLVYVGKVSTGGGIRYKYVYYTRTKSNSCSCPNGGSLSGSKCYISSSYNATPHTTYTCPNGGNLSGSTCYTSSSYNATPHTSYGCPNGGTRDGNKCTITINATQNTTYSCPSGYDRNGTECYKTYDATPSHGEGIYVCPNGGVLNGKKCVITVDATKTPGKVTYSCPTGYEYNKETKKCESKVNADKKDIYKYSCPTGYTKIGDGADTKCQRKVKDDDKYYCEDANAVFNEKNKTCTSTIKGEQNGYTCPTDYILQGDKCIKKSISTIDATVETKTNTTYKYTWSRKSKLDGWEFTGKTKTKWVTYNAGQR